MIVIFFIERQFEFFIYCGLLYAAVHSIDVHLKIDSFMNILLAAWIDFLGQMKYLMNKWQNEKISIYRMFKDDILTVTDIWLILRFDCNWRQIEQF